MGLLTQPDPIGFEGRFNLYAYAGGDPINNRDPFGLCHESNPATINPGEGVRLFEVDFTCKGHGNAPYGFEFQGGDCWGEPCEPWLAEKFALKVAEGVVEGE